MRINVIGYGTVGKAQTVLLQRLKHEVFIFDPQRIKELHQMRIAAKKLRYSLEIFSSLYQQKTDFALDVARETQGFLGQIHDADVWISFLPEFMERESNRIKLFYGYLSPFSRLKPGIEYLIQNRQKERKKLYQKFLENWRTWKLEETWLNLRKVIFLTSIEDLKTEEAKNDEISTTSIEESLDHPQDPTT